MRRWQAPRRRCFEAIDAGDVERVRALLTQDSVARARLATTQGVSALLRARYRLDRSARLGGALARVGELDAPRSGGASATPTGSRCCSTPIRRSSTRVRRDGFTLLHLAAFFAGADAVRLLLARGADVDAHGTGWMTGTALHSAVSAGDAEAVRALLEAGADPNARQQGGYTPLHGAAHNGDAPIVRMLARRRRRPALTNDEGRDARIVRGGKRRRRDDVADRASRGRRLNGVTEDTAIR